MYGILFSLIIATSPSEIFQQILPHRESRCVDLEYFNKGSLDFKVVVDGYSFQGSGLFSEHEMENSHTTYMYESSVIDEQFSQLQIILSDTEILDVIIRRYKNSSKGQPLWGLEDEVICLKKQN